MTPRQAVRFNLVLYLSFCAIGLVTIFAGIEHERIRTWPYNSNDPAIAGTIYDAIVIAFLLFRPRIARFLIWGELAVGILFLFFTTLFWDFTSLSSLASLHWLVFEKRGILIWLAGRALVLGLYLFNMIRVVPRLG